MARTSNLKIKEIVPANAETISLVGLTRHNLNSQLAHYLRGHPIDVLRKGMSQRQSRRVWRIRDRLSERDIGRLILAFKLGAPKYVLEERYNISMNSIKKLLREHGVKKRSRYDIP